MNASDFALYPFGVVTDSHTWTQPSYRATLSHQFTPEFLRTALIHTASVPAATTTR